MSEIGKHNVKTYLKACGMYKKVAEEMNPNVIINLMEGYAQLYHNRQKKANEVNEQLKEALPLHNIVPSVFIAEDAFDNLFVVFAENIDEAESKLRDKGHVTCLINKPNIIIH